MHFKITNKEERHGDMSYHDGLNVDVLPFNPSGECEPGGIYFSDEKNILRFCDYAGKDGWIREVTLPEDAQVYHEECKYKADKVILGERKPLRDADTFKWLIECNVNIHAKNDLALQWATENGHLSVVQFLVENGANIHANDDYALQLAASCGHLSVVQFLVENGANVHANNNYALRWAAENGHLSVVQFLVENGTDIHAGNDYALRRAAYNGHLSVVKFLVENGANIHANDNSALRLAKINNHNDIVEYLKNL